MRHQSFWMSKARRLVRRYNLALWADRFLPMAGIMTVVAAIALLGLRIFRMPNQVVWIALAVGLVVTAGLAWYLSKPHFFSSTDALARFDEIGRLYNRLTAAYSGVGAWATPNKIGDGFRWNWPRLVGMVVPAVIVLIAAAKVDLPNPHSRDRITEPPLVWEEVDSWLQTLEQSQLIQPEALEKLREQMNEIRRQPMQNWYSHASLEASDLLRERTEQALKNMLSDMEASEQAMSAATKMDESATSVELRALNESLQKSLRGLEMGHLPLNKELLNDLKKIDTSKLKQVSAKQLAELQAKLKAGIRVCEKCIGPSIRAGEKLVPAQSGGKGGGGKTAPLTLKNEPTNLHTKETETVTNDDLSHASLGDVVSVNKGEHEVKKDTPKLPLAAGSIESNGQGGEAVWRDMLTPEDQEILRRFFK